MVIKSFKITPNNISKRKNNKEKREIEEKKFLNKNTLNLFKNYWMMINKTNI